MTEDGVVPRSIRLLTIFVEEGQEPTVMFEGFAYWEAQAVLAKALEIVEMLEEEAREPAETEDA